MSDSATDRKAQYRAYYQKLKADPAAYKQKVARSREYQRKRRAKARARKETIET